MMTGIPVQRIAEKESGKLARMNTDLEGKVIGQEEAIKKVVKAIKRNRGSRASRYDVADRGFHNPGYAFYMDLGIHVNGFLVVHNFIHYHLKKLTFTCLLYTSPSPRDS